jgi:alkanesulfonate monooxygenase SsuD/methylene tetrahydromethanopterin reductase-like flavin-dependent oxidoreductase (luciferase family)
MKLGYFTLTDNPAAYGPTRRDPNRFILDVMEECVEADAMGFSSVWVPDHHFGMFGVLSAPTVFLSQVAARTKHVRLGTGTVLLPCSHPLRIVEEFNMLDLLSGGRAIFSAGRGYDEREYVAFGVPFEKSREIFDEQMAYVMAAWRQSPFSFQGKYYSTPDPVLITPSPVQRPHPEVYVAAFSKPSVELAARLGVNTIFAPFAAAMVFGSILQAARASKDMAREAGNPAPKVMCSYFTQVAHSHAEETQARERLLHYLQSVAPAFPSDRSKAPPHIAYFADIVERIRSMTPTDLGDRSIVTGSPDHCIEVLKQCEEAGVDEIILYFNFGELSHLDTLKSMERFAKEVLPHFG